MNTSGGIYVHIPFCVRKCRYCDFNSFAGTSGQQEDYTEALIREIRGSDVMESRVSSIFFGGGTPSVLREDLTGRIVEALQGRYDLSGVKEMSIEVNPGTVTGEKLRTYRQLGFNRISIGVQSFDDGELALLGRIHTAAEAVEAFHLAREAGFTNINLDLITQLPGQSTAGLERTLESALGLGSTHISCYSLIVEEGTPFFKEYGEGGPKRDDLPDEDGAVEMDGLVREMLSAAGYERYEVSNFAKPGFECLHNMGYWKRNEYRGYGLSAASLLRTASDARSISAEYRFSAEERFEDYLKDSAKPLSQRSGASEERRLLSPGEAMSEFMFLGLRCVSGIRAEDFKESFGRSVTEVFGPVLDRQISQGFIKRYESEGSVCYAFTGGGMDVSNVLLAEYML